MALSAQRCIRIHLNKLITASLRVNLLKGMGVKFPRVFRKSSDCFMLVFISDVISRASTKSNVTTSFFSVCRHLIHYVNMTPTSHQERFISNTSSYLYCHCKDQRKMFRFCVRIWLSSLLAQFAFRAVFRDVVSVNVLAHLLSRVVLHLLNTMSCTSRLKKYKQAREDQMFPDEVDTPDDVPARTRFQRYLVAHNLIYFSWIPP